MTEERRTTICIADVNFDCPRDVCELFAVCDGAVKLVAKITGASEKKVIETLRTDPEQRQMIEKWNEELVDLSPILSALCLKKRSQN